MRIVMTGINHHTAGVELREKLAMGPGAAERVLGLLRGRFPGCEWVVLSTCCRTEVYFARPKDAEPTADQALGVVAEACAVEEERLRAASIHRENAQAVAHLFRVATGLDSIVLGEPQILGQVKEAYELAHRCGAVGPSLHLVFQQAVAGAKQLRTTTGINSGRVSLGSVAVDFARRIFERFDDKTVVGVGAGEMAKIALQHLRGLGPAKLWLVNRTLSRAQELVGRLRILAQEGGARGFEDLEELLVEADIVVTSVGGGGPILTADQMRPLIRRRRLRPLFVIDIAVPRNVDPAVGTLTNVYLYNIDDLQHVVSQTHQARSEEAQRCEQHLMEAVHACMADVQNRDLGQLIRALKHQLQVIGRDEMRRTQRKLRSASGEELEEILEQHTHRLINKILHLPLSQLDRRRPDAPLAFYAAALRRLFGLDASSLAGQQPDEVSAGVPAQNRTAKLPRRKAIPLRPPGTRGSSAPGTRGSSSPGTPGPGNSGSDGGVASRAVVGPVVSTNP